MSDYDLKQKDLWLRALAESLNISQTQIEKLLCAYQSVGNALEPAQVTQVYSQGSFHLGTLIRPLTEEDDGYDVDMVAIIENPEISRNPCLLKHAVGDCLKNHGIYQGKIDEEGKKCWTLHYQGFHIDILPSTPRVDCNLGIKITNKKDDGDYEFQLSNPKGYARWFRERNHQHFRKIYLEKKASEDVEIEDIPIHSTRLPLQMAIQILKRHRDRMFADKEHAPISIIITTLAAQAYEGEENLFLALKEILEKMPTLIGKLLMGNRLLPIQLKKMKTLPISGLLNLPKQRIFIPGLDKQQLT